MPFFDFVNRSNADYIERQYEQYKKDPRSVDENWQAFFAGFETGYARTDGQVNVQSTGEGGELAHVGIYNLVHSYRELGHYVAKIDPLGHDRPNHPLLELSQFGVSTADLDMKVGRGNFMGPTDGTLRDLIEKLRVTYCGSLGVEFQDIADKAQRDWLTDRMEPGLNRPNLSPAEKKALLFELVAAQGFEEYLATKFVGAKRFGLEGAEAFIPLLNKIVDDGAILGVEEAVMGMAHRGRLNTLAHVLNKPYEQIMAEFLGNIALEEDDGDGDVKYHLGYSQDRKTASDKTIHLALSFNPSHLELVNPVVEGIVRAKQYHRKDDNRTKVVPILIHGDAAFCGQGIVQETLALSEMPYWRTGGTIHVIVNNQIGFTTMPKQGRFTPYPTDVAKMIQAPIFHVNGDDPEMVVHAGRLAIAFRQQFHQDVMIDLWSYRRNGHNEADEPEFTQPLMYREIKAHPKIRDMYAKKLIDEKVVTPEEYEAMQTKARERFDKALTKARESRPRPAVATMGGVWKNMSRAGADWTAKTAVNAETLKAIAERCVELPAGFTPHPKLMKTLQTRADMGRGKAPIDWAGAEMMALGSLLVEGTPIRFVGQDVQRGTFGHRHACLHDYNNGSKYYPLANITPTQAPIIVVNTMLSELAVLGFEYGFSSADPRNLVMWEAQFGDFVNGTQAIIDQFLVAAESKWGKQSGLIMLLPHGYEGAGPEHSNAYLERWLQACAENNIQVCYPSMPSQYFHVLRRQQLRKFRKPLIMMMPKVLLRSGLPGSASQLSDLTEGEFQLVLDDPTNPDRNAVKKVLFCSGKIFFLLNQAREKEAIKDTAIVRVEQLYPFPKKEIQAILSKYSGAQEICWVQEEPANRGAWTFMQPRLRPLLRDNTILTYHGREESASPATGSSKIHLIEEEEIIGHALDLPARKSSPAAAVKTEQKEAAIAAASDSSPKQPAVVTSPKQQKE